MVVPVSYARDGLMTGSHLVLPSDSILIRVGIVSGRGWSPWTCLWQWQSWMVAWTASAMKALVGYTDYVCCDINPSLLQTSGVSFILCDAKMPGTLKFWWSSVSQLQLVIALPGPKRLST
jgi:hypothetical protein